MLLVGLWCCEPMAHTWAQQQGRLLSDLVGYSVLSQHQLQVMQCPIQMDVHSFSTAGLTSSLLKARRTVSSPSSSCFLPSPLACQHQVLNKSSRM